MRNILENFGF